jgi:hypothetical protein
MLTAVAENSRLNTGAPQRIAQQLKVMSDRFPTFEVTLKKRHRGWSWSVCSTGGRVLMLGFELNRLAARYKANSALFLLLAAPSRPLPSVPAAGERRFARK